MMTICNKEIIENMCNIIINHGMDILEIFSKIATVIIACANLYFVCKFHKTIKEQNMIKSLILDYSMQHFYDFFNKIMVETERLKNRNLTEDEKNNINNKIIESERDFENKFVSLLNVVDDKLYSSIKGSTDKMIDGITNAIFNEGINLYNENQFDTNIKDPMLTTQRVILKKILESTKK